MTKNILILIIILPAFIFFILNGILKISFSYYPLSFGLTIGLINWKAHKHKPNLGVILSVAVSYVSFYLGFFSFAITGNIFDFMSGDSGSILGLTISTCVIAPLLVFSLYRFVFNISKTKLTILVVSTSITLLILQNYFFYITNLNLKSINSFTGWQVIMALALQLILYQNELKALFKPKIKK